MTGRCVRSSVGPGFDSVESYFFFFFFSPPLFFSSPLSPRLAFLFFPSFFCPPLISSSFPCLPSFFLSTILFPFVFFLFLLLVSPFLLLFFLSFLPLFYFPDFFLLFLSSFFFSSLTQNDDFLWFVYSYDRSNWILTDQTGFLSPFWQTMYLPYPLHCLILLANCGYLQTLCMQVNSQNDVHMLITSQN